mmetsp:Transcript_19807/g.76022  ORF Transcript_19807/g.76022 Transcript_19807/m.76022 type:complete len:91 (-) Transcript_19807:102-374(-)
MCPTHPCWLQLRVCAPVTRGRLQSGAALGQNCRDARCLPPLHRAGSGPVVSARLRQQTPRAAGAAPTLLNSCARVQSPSGARLASAATRN